MLACCVQLLALRRRRRAAAQRRREKRDAQVQRLEQHLAANDRDGGRNKWTAIVALDFMTLRGTLYVHSFKMIHS